MKIIERVLPTIVFGLFFHHQSMSKLLKLEKSKVLSNIFREIAKQQSLTGFTLISSRHSKPCNLAIANQIRKVITRLSTVSSIDHRVSHSHHPTRYLIYDYDSNIANRVNGTSTYLLASSRVLALLYASQLLILSIRKMWKNPLTNCTFQSRLQICQNFWLSTSKRNEQSTWNNSRKQCLSATCWNTKYWQFQWNVINWELVQCTLYIR